MARPTRSEPALDLGATGDGAGAPSDLEDADLEDANPAPVGDPALEDYRRAHHETLDRLWWAAAVVYRGKWWIMAVTVLVAAAAVYLTLQIPNRYQSETRVLLPESGGGGLLSGALSNLPSAAAALIGGGGGGGFTRYMAILDSPSTLETVVDRFDLVRVYDLEDEEAPRSAAIAELRDRTDFDVNLDYDYLGIYVLDESPQRAAQVADFFVERLNERNIEFQSESAAEYRQDLGVRLEQAQSDLEAALGDLQALQERSGVVEPTAQAEALFSTLGAATAEVTAMEVQYQSLLSQYGPENPTVESARAAVNAARSQVQGLRSGAEAGLPSLGALPRVQREYAGVMQRVATQRAIVETVTPLYEQAALQESREADAVQVLDPASIPTKKAEPRRSLIVLGATVSAFLVALAMVLFVAIVRRTGPAVLHRLRTA